MRIPAGLRGRLGMGAAGMSGSRRPVALRPGALRALLRQPDLPPDLVAKISERAGDLARAEQERAAETARAVAWEAVLRRLPVVLLSLLALAVAVGVAYLLSPVPPEAVPEPSTIAGEPEDGQPVAPAPAPLPASVQGEQPAATAEPASPPSARPAEGATSPLPVTAVRAKAAPARPSATHPAGTDGAREINVSPSRPVPSEGEGAQPSRSAPASSPPTVSAQPGSSQPAGRSETAPATPVNVPTTVPLVVVPPQP